MTDEHGGSAALSDWGIAGTYVFDSTRSRLGYELNKLAFSMRHPANRDAFRADEAAYLAKFRLSKEARSAIEARDWLTLVKQCGGNIYYVYKLGAAVGEGLYHMGAQMRGMSFEEFLATRAAKNAR